MRAAYRRSHSSRRARCGGVGLNVVQGARLAGAPLARVPERRGVELPSEGLVLGAVQVPADGQPLVFLADHPTTGGYPVIAVVDDSDVDTCAQVRPGDEVRFRWSVSSGEPAGGVAGGRYGAGP